MTRNNLPGQPSIRFDLCSITLCKLVNSNLKVLQIAFFSISVDNPKRVAKASVDVLPKRIDIKNWGHYDNDAEHAHALAVL